jgi:hypothetical protein
MASVFVAVGPIMLFALAKDPSPFYRSLLEKVSPMALMMSLVVLAFPTWAVVGAAIGLVYRESTTGTPGGEMGSTNLAYTLAIVAVGVVGAAPVALLLRRVVVGVAVLTLTFVGVFGWFLPFFAG